MNATTSLPPGLSRCYVRLAGFLALSIAAHLLTALGAAPLATSLQSSGNAPAGGPLQATLVQAPPRESSHATVARGPGGGDNANAAITSTAAAAPAQAPATGEERGLALPAPDKWYAASEVDVRAEPLTDVRLRYPDGLAEQFVTGTVRVRLFIDEGGVVRKLQIAASEPAGLFDEAARRGWEDVRFSPARRNGAPVKSQKLIELTFRPGQS